MVELDGARIPIIFLYDSPIATRMKNTCGNSMRYRCVDEVAVVQGLQAEIGELQISLGQQALAPVARGRIPETWEQQLQLHAALA